MTKRIICILMLLIFVSQGCFAQGFIMDKIEPENHIPLSGVLFEKGGTVTLEEEPVSFFSTSRLTFDEYIACFIEAYMLEYNELPMEIVGLEQYEIHKDEFFDKYIHAVLKHPETLLKTGYIDIGLVLGTDIVGAVIPTYHVANKAEADLARDDMEKAVAEYVAIAENYSTDLEKMLVIHDKMVADCDYDVRILDKTNTEPIDDTIYHALGALRDNFAVCQGYSQALYMIAKELDIELDFCYSEDINHIWNYVKLDGQWYHMDMTNDDFPDTDENGKTIARKDPRAWHRYFMVSDDGLNEAAHGTDYRTMSGEEIVCEDKRYESDHLFNMNSVVFTAEKGEDGYFNVNVEIPGPLGTPIIIPFKSESLYTGAIVTSPVEIKVPAEGASEVTNLYLAQYTTKSIPVVKPFVKTNDGIKAYDVQEESTKDTFNMVTIADDVENNPVEGFTAYFFEPVTLRPWSIAKTWNLQ